MSVRSVLDRLKAAGTFEEWWTEPFDPTPRRPDCETIAFFVAWCRDTKQLSLEALASMANVSVSSIERIERSEQVSDKILLNVAVALDQDENAFTAVRTPLSRETVLRKLERSAAEFDGTIQVPVSRFTKQRQVRDLSRCHVIIVDGSRLHDDAQPAVDALREWIDLASFERARRENPVFIGPESPIKVRRLNGDVLAAVGEVERIGHATALTGCYDAEMTYTDYCNSVPKLQAMPIRTGLVGFFPKMTDPCAIKRPFLLGPSQVPFQPSDL